MSFLSKAIQPFTQWYSEINSATLTGAIDVLIIEQEDGSFQSSPFHVRFGKLGVLKAKEKIVDIVINDEPVDIHMKLDDTGAAFFVEELSESEEEDDLPPELATSPLPGAFAKGNINPAAANSSANRSLIDEFNAVEENNKMSKEQIKGKIGRKKRKLRRAAAGAARHVRGTPTHGGAKAENEGNSSESDEQEKRKAGDEIFDLEDNDNDGDLDDDDTETPGNSLPHVPSVSTSTPHHTKSSADTNQTQHSEQSFLESRLGGENIDDLLKTQDNEEKNKKKPMLKEIAQYFSEPEMTPVMSPAGSRPSTPVLSDTEFEIRRQLSHKEGSPSSSLEGADMGEEQSWEWGKFPSTSTNSGAAVNSGKKDAEGKDHKNIITSDDEDEARQRSWTFSFWKSKKMNKDEAAASAAGVYLDDLKDDEELMSIYLGRNTNRAKNSAEKSVTGGLAIPNASQVEKDEDAESGNGPSLPMSPHSVEGAVGGRRIRYDSSDEEGARKVLPDISFSLCGGLEERPQVEEEKDVASPPEKTAEGEAVATPSKRVFSNQLFEQSLLTYDDFVLRLKSDHDLFSDPNLVVRIGDQFYTWEAACPIIMSAVLFNRSLPSDLVQIIQASYQEARSSKESSTSPSSKVARSSSWWPFRRGAPQSEDVESATVISSTVGIETKSSDDKSSVTITTETVTTASDTEVKVEKKLEVDVTVSEEVREGSPVGKTCKKTLRLNSDLIKKLGLRPGANEAEFSVTTAYQGTSRCKCHIYCWKYTDKIVISDIDGTITKSDVLGHVLPIIGRDWAQSGVASLFSKIVDNGYHIAYLSARAIGQASVTKDYLSSIRQGNLNLPDGPLFLNPTSLINAFHREVIEKKPEKFKIACLRDIQKLFPENRNPFYAGYGNRVNDVFAYTTVGIPISRIFTINSKGELRHELTQTFQTSYDCQSSIVDHIFPPIKADDIDSPSTQLDYSSFAYWRDPIQSDLIEVTPPKVEVTPEVVPPPTEKGGEKEEKAKERSSSESTNETSVTGSSTPKEEDDGASISQTERKEGQDKATKVTSEPPSSTTTRSS